jgi:putative membrane protein
MGIANLIPGVSAGTIALIVGIYERFISSLAFVFSSLKNIKRLLQSKEFSFLLSLGLGILTSILGFSRVMKFLLDNFSVQTFSFFIGLIGASIFLVAREVKKFHPALLIFLALGFGFGFFLSGSFQAQVSHSLPWIFFSGFFAVSGMILPGISGAYVLAMLGQYEYLLSVVISLHIPVIVVFSGGALLSFFVMSNFLKWLLSRYHDATIVFLIGIMVGGLRSLVGPSMAEPVTMAFFILGGMLAVALLELLASLRRSSPQA